MKLFIIFVMLNIYANNYKYSYCPKSNVTRPKSVSVKPFDVGHSYFMKTIDYLGQTIDVYEDGKANNHVSNLEWCDRIYNVRYYVSKGRGVYEKFPVLCFNKEGKMIKEYPSLESTGLENNWNSENVFFIVSNKYNTAYGFHWIYKHNYNSEIHTIEYIKNKFINPFKKSVIAKKHGELIGEYSSISKAAAFLFPNSPLTARNKIRECLNGKIKHYFHYEFTNTQK